MASAPPAAAYISCSWCAVTCEVLLHQDGPCCRGMCVYTCICGHSLVIDGSERGGGRGGRGSSYATNWNRSGQMAYARSTGRGRGGTPAVLLAAYVYGEQVHIVTYVRAVHSFPHGSCRTHV